MTENMRVNFFNRVCAGAMLVAAASCSNGSSSIVPGTQIASGGTGRPASTQATAPVTVVMQWPKLTKQTIHSNYISPSTASLTIETTPVKGGKTILTVANNPGTPTSAITFEVPVGSDTFVISLWSGKQRAGASAPVGKELADAQVTKTIVANANNKLSFTANGIPAGIAVSLSPGQQYALLSGPVGNQLLRLAPGGATTIVLSPLDAGGNIIVAPGVVPATTLAVDNTDAGQLTVAPVKGKANTYDVGLTNPTSTAFALLATAKTGNFKASANIAVALTELIYVGYSKAAGPHILAFSPSGKPVTLAANAFSGVGKPVALSYDPDDHWVFVADASGKIAAFNEFGSPISAFPAMRVKHVTAISYYNDAAGRSPSLPTPTLSSNPRRLLVASTDAIQEFSMSGEGIGSATLPFTPTSIGGRYDGPGFSQSGALLVVGDPIDRAIEVYDMASLQAIPLAEIPLDRHSPLGLTFMHPCPASDGCDDILFVVASQWSAFTSYDTSNPSFSEEVWLYPEQTAMPATFSSVTYDSLAVASSSSNNSISLYCTETASNNVDNVVFTQGPAGATIAIDKAASISSPQWYAQPTSVALGY